MATRAAVMPKGKGSKRAKARRNANGNQNRDLVSIPVSLGMRGSVASPVLRNTPRGTIIENCESVARLVAGAEGGTEVITVVPLSVQNPTQLPWLNQLGQLYSKYRVLSMKLTYEPYCPTSLGGEIAMCLVYDENDTSLVDAARILQTYGNVRSPVWSTTAPVVYDRTKAAHPWLVSKLNPQATTLANLSVSSWLLVSAQGSQPAAALGRIMCQYKIELVEPISPTMND